MGFIFDLYPAFLNYAGWAILILVPLSILLRIFIALVKRLTDDGYLAKETSGYLFPIAKYSMMLGLYMFLAIMVSLLAKAILTSLGVDL